jgi:hypothetical protein
MVQMAAWNPNWPILMVKEKVNQEAQAAQFAAHRLEVLDLDNQVTAWILLSNCRCSAHCEPKDHWPAA